MISLDIADLRALYSKGGNIMAAFRQAAGKATNSAEAVKISYDLQSGSYTKAWAEPAYRQRHDLYCEEIAGILSSFGPTSLLEAGVGEATTLCSVVSALETRPLRVSGFDISWSRILFARRNAEESGFRDFFLCTGQLENIPFTDNSFDVVYTAHAVEPNHGREEQIIHELLRVTRDKLVLFEPSYELGGAATRARIDMHGYCRGLPAAAEKSGGRIVSHELLINPMRAENATSALVIEKARPLPEPRFENDAVACPRCRSTLLVGPATRYCERCGMAYLELGGIPCLLPENGILATSYNHRG